MSTHHHQQHPLSASPTVISVDRFEDAGGRPVAHIDVNAGQVVVFIHQAPTGCAVLIEAHTRDDHAEQRLRMLLDGRALHPRRGDRLGPSPPSQGPGPEHPAA
ncbi:hypothetical protein AB0K60_13560 [Thermopolyspora sp. NPDC052614]|uniref:hypothetical protein n=1 Tax=Thermopolyspora sp. NPDC052614 TaxID=3155682 RepID=UPI0034479D81